MCSCAFTFTVKVVSRVMFDIYEKSRYVTIIHILFKNYSCCKILEEDIVVKLRSEQMRSEEIRSEHGARSTELHGCYRRLLLSRNDERSESGLKCGFLF